MASLLTLVQDACDRIGLVRPSSVVGSADQQVRRLLAMSNEDGRSIARRYPWQALSKEKTFTTVAAEAQTGAVPSDFDRFVPGTVYNRTRTRLITGPLTAQEYADNRGRLTSIVYEAFRLRGDAFLLLPTPSAGQTIAFEYISKFWIGAASSTTPSRSEWADDTDIPYLDDELLRLGMVWRYLRSRGLDYAEPFTQYELLLAQLTARDGGARTLYMGTTMTHRVPRAPQAPDGNWNIS